MHLFVLHRIAKCCMAMRHITLYSKIFALLMSPPPKASADLKGAVRLCEPADTELSPFRISDWIKAVISNSSFEPHHKNLQCGIHSPSFIPCIRPTDQSTAIFPKLRSQCFVLSSSSVIIPVEKSIAIELWWDVVIRTSEPTFVSSPSILRLSGLNQEDTQFLPRLLWTRNTKSLFNWLIARPKSLMSSRARLSVRSFSRVVSL